MQRPLINFHADVVHDTGTVEGSLIRLEEEARAILDEHRLTLRSWVNAVDVRKTIRTPHIALMLRASTWWSDETGAVLVLDIITAFVPEEHRRKGVFKRALGVLERLAEECARVLRIEGIIHSVAGKFLERHGYRPSKQDPQTYMRLPTCKILKLMP